MSEKRVEDRLEDLEHQVSIPMARMQSTNQSDPSSAKDWRKSVGMFKDRPVMKEIASVLKIESVPPVIILETDHLSTLKYSDSPRFLRLAERMADAQEQDFVTTVSSLEEQMHGWRAGSEQTIQASFQ